MQIIWVRHKKTTEFVLTEFGLEHTHVRKRMGSGEDIRKVPRSWLDNGYVVEVERGQK